MIEIKMKEVNFKKDIPAVLNNIQYNLTEYELNCIFTECEITDFLIDRRDFPNKEKKYSCSPWDEEKVRKAATEKWNSSSLKEKREIISKWAKTCLEALSLNVYYPSSN